MIIFLTVYNFFFPNGNIVCGLLQAIKGRALKNCNMVSQLLSQNWAQSDTLQKRPKQTKENALNILKIHWCAHISHILQIQCLCPALGAALEMLQDTVHIVAHFTASQNALAFDIGTPITFSLEHRGCPVYISNRSLVTFWQ